MGSVCLFVCLFVFVVLFWGSTSGLYAVWLARRQYVINVIWRRRKCGRVVCFACITWLYGLFVRTLISRTDAYDGCDRLTLNIIKRFLFGSLRSDSEASRHVSRALAAAAHVQTMPHTSQHTRDLPNLSCDCDL